MAADDRKKIKDTLANMLNTLSIAREPKGQIAEALILKTAVSHHRAIDPLNGIQQRSDKRLTLVALAFSQKFVVLQPSAWAVLDVERPLKGGVTSNGDMPR